jgi:hypothetical protein
MKTKSMLLLCVVLCAVTIAWGQQDTTWKQWQWLLGNWVGVGSGAPGQGSGWFSLHPDLGGTILMRKNHAEYPPARGKPGTIHDDIMIVYHSGAAGPDRAIYFDNEGHTIAYTIAYGDSSIALTSETVEDRPVFRLKYSALDPETVDVAFQMSRDGETFTTYTEGKCRRRR